MIPKTTVPMPKWKTITGLICAFIAAGLIAVSEYYWGGAAKEYFIGLFVLSSSWAGTGWLHKDMKRMKMDLGSQVIQGMGMAEALRQNNDPGIGPTKNPTAKNEGSTNT